MEDGGEWAGPVVCAALQTHAPAAPQAAQADVGAPTARAIWFWHCRVGGRALSPKSVSKGCPLRLGHPSFLWDTAEGGGKGHPRKVPPVQADAADQEGGRLLFLRGGHRCSAWALPPRSLFDTLLF